MQSIQHGLADIASVRYAHSFDAVAEGFQFWLIPAIYVKNCFDYALENEWPSEEYNLTGFSSHGLGWRGRIKIYAAWTYLTDMFEPFHYAKPEAIRRLLHP